MWWNWLGFMIHHIKQLQIPTISQPKHEVELKLNVLDSKNPFSSLSVQTLYKWTWYHFIIFMFQCDTCIVITMNYHIKNTSFTFNSQTFNSLKYSIVFCYNSKSFKLGWNLLLCNKYHTWLCEKYTHHVKLWYCLLFQRYSFVQRC